MLKNILFSKKFLIGFGIFILVILLFSLLKSSIIPPTLIVSNPTNNANKFSTMNPLELKFKESVINSDFDVISSPENIWTVNQLTDTALTITHQKQLFSGTKYLLTLNWKGKYFATLNFTTEETQKDFELIKNVKEEIAKNYPLATLMPYETPRFRVVYSGPLTLEITIKNPNLTSEEVIDEVKAWVTRNGANAEEHKYNIAQ